MADVDVLEHCCTTLPVSRFAPTSCVIQAITRGMPTLVTTFTEFNFADGTIVRLTISPSCGMRQINKKIGPVTVLTPTTFTLPIDSQLFDPFIVPEDPGNPGFPPALAQPCSFVVSIGELNEQLNMAVHNVQG